MKNLKGGQRRIKAVFVLVCAFVLLAGVQAQAGGVQIFINGNILTMNDEQPTAEAVAVKDGKILAVGRMLKVGNQPMVIQGEYYYNIEKPDAAPDQRVSLLFQFLFPKK